jgi:hypothetical protein
MWVRNLLSPPVLAVVALLLSLLGWGAVRLWRIARQRPWYRPVGLAAAAFAVTTVMGVAAVATWPSAGPPQAAGQESSAPEVAARTDASSLQGQPQTLEPQDEEGASQDEPKEGSPSRQGADEGETRFASAYPTPWVTDAPTTAPRPSGAATPTTQGPSLPTSTQGRSEKPRSPSPSPSPEPSPRPSPSPDPEPEPTKPPKPDKPDKPDKPPAPEPTSPAPEPSPEPEDADVAEEPQPQPSRQVCKKADEEGANVPKPCREGS